MGAAFTSVRGILCGLRTRTAAAAATLGEAITGAAFAGDVARKTCARRSGAWAVVGAPMQHPRPRHSLYFLDPFPDFCPHSVLRVGPNTQCVTLKLGAHGGAAGVLIGAV